MNIFVPPRGVPRLGDYTYHARSVCTRLFGVVARVKTAAT
jgi:hypothetical protein